MSSKMQRFSRLLSSSFSPFNIFPRFLLTPPSTYGTVVDQPHDSVRALRKKLEAHVLFFKNANESNHNAVVTPPNQSTLEPRTMVESLDRVKVPLSTDEKVRLQYLNFMGFARFGRLLEDLDTFAVWLSYLHNQGLAHRGQPPVHHPMLLVTACVDRISLRSNRAIDMSSDVYMEGHISHVGTSSIEASMQCVQKQDGEWIQLVDAKFVMVALNPAAANKTVPVHPLTATSDGERAIIAAGDQARALRRREEEHSLLRQPPEKDERQELHNLFLQTIDEESHTFRHRVLPENSVWMEDSKLKNVIICFPEQRNLYNKIFGGFLMRQAFELAWTNAALFCKDVARVVAVDDINFRRSVEIGSLLFLSSEVCYTNGTHMQVRVHAECVMPRTGERYTTNTFHFTFTHRGEQYPVKKVVPKTYADGMLYLSGKRHFESAIAQL